MGGALQAGRHVPAGRQATWCSRRAHTQHGSGHAGGGGLAGRGPIARCQVLQSYVGLPGAPLWELAQHQGGPQANPSRAAP
eukprot:6942290-Alexandrium_andersonii.AAC.1